MSRERSPWATSATAWRSIRARATRSAGRRRRGRRHLGQRSADSGVELDGSSDNLVEGNFIGTDATGTTALGNAQAGVEIDAVASTDNTIGGTSAVAGNLITDNGGPGVVVSSSDASVGNQITANRIFGNTGQAIDLGDDGVTDNATAPRQGPNNLQNFPIIVTTADGQTRGLAGRQHARHDLPHRLLRQRRLRTRRLGRGRRTTSARWR